MRAQRRLIALCLAAALLGGCSQSGGAGKPFLKVDFQELYVTNHQLSGSSEIPSESVSFSYNQIKIEYSTQDEKGVITTAGSVTYNTKTNVTS